MSGNPMGATAPDTTRSSAQDVQLTPAEEYAAFVEEHRKEVARIVKAVGKDPRYDYKAPKRPLAPSVTATQQKRTYG